MQTETYRKSYELVPRVRRQDREEGETRRKVGPYETSPVLGVWTLAMLSALRRLYEDAEKMKDSVLKKRIERAYWYLYTRTEKKRKEK